MSAATDHPVYANGPARGEVTLSTGTAPTPYHVYDGHGLLIVGTCNAGALEGTFAEQDVHPVLTRVGRGILLLFVCDFAEASHGPHTELHLTALAAPMPGQVLPDDPAAAIACLPLQTDWGVLSLNLWNNTPEVVAYNTEYLGLQAMQMAGSVTVGEKAVAFDFTDPSGAALVAGKVRRNARSDVGLMWRVMRHLGLRGVMKVGGKKPALVHVINRKCEVIPRNGRAQTWTAADQLVVTGFDVTKDQLVTDQGPLAAYGFAPQLFEHVSPFRFVYLHPDDA